MIAPVSSSLDIHLDIFKTYEGVIRMVQSENFAGITFRASCILAASCDSPKCCRYQNNLDMCLFEKA